MHRGFEKIIDFIFSEGFSNVRSCLKSNNKLEIENEVSAFNISFFQTHLVSSNIPLLKKLYTNLVDIMQLSNFLDLFTQALENPTPTNKLIFDFILSDHKFHSLFVHSLELQKFIFIREMLGLCDEFEHDSIDVIRVLLQKEPFLQYYNWVDTGEDLGEEYAEVMRRHVEKLAEQKRLK
jgi:hypothetical protein